MCGIIMLIGPHAAVRLPECLNRLRHRGPDDLGVWEKDNMALGFTRLAINSDLSSGHQPFQHGDLIGAINGEIYNHVELSNAFGMQQNGCDTHIILPLFEINGPRVIDKLDGFYSAVIVRPRTHEVFCLRDHIGKKPLFVGYSQSELFITSELKIFNEIDWFEPLPRGVSKVDLETGVVQQLAEHCPVRPKENITRLLEQAVLKRLPHTEQPVGVFLSGGLDSSIVAYFVSRNRNDAIYFTLGDEDSPDREAVEILITALGLKNMRFIALPSNEQIEELLSLVVYATESYNPSIVSNGLATFLLARAAHEAGIKVVLTGEGADELFGGYHLFRNNDPWREVRAQLIDDMHFTELRRLDMSCMAHNIESRCPFLDRTIRGFSDCLDFQHLYENNENKVILRRNFTNLLPQEILHRAKNSFDVGSGIRAKVVKYLQQNGRSEREELQKIWRQHFDYDALTPYFHDYPVFNEVINRRGVKHR